MDYAQTNQGHFHCPNRLHHLAGENMAIELLIGVDLDLDTCECLLDWCVWSFAIVLQL